ncbi:hypothetical protein HYH03_002745 [Edaphochlamys debaryana]|uniref:Transmembrane protein 186 n=1 Tax=Edaphochlamys debaryana TaxID=47281 RepID=A0A836C4V3_9CHLO|nr:hypothetical protein HYH03_002745 [Edaphochlamys debaryana]|eukprot:KAG2499164.1 hypothetical protein HYH03_002745 [Edaphochlamys debaryana]
MSTDRASSFDGLTLQLPSNPFNRKPRVAVPKLVLYRGKGMLFFRFIVRAKVFQLMGFLACAVFASVVLTTTNPNPWDLAAVGALAVGCIVTSYCIWYYSGRYVGELSVLLPEKRTVRFSVLDFWGNREDNDVPVERVVAPWRHRSVAEVKSQARQALMPLVVTGDREYYISVPHGHVLQKDVLQRLLYGAPLDGEDPGFGAAAAGPSGATASAAPGEAATQTGPAATATSSSGAEARAGGAGQASATDAGGEGGKGAGGSAVDGSGVGEGAGAGVTGKGATAESTPGHERGRGA